ncbi:hypothetical protein BJX64DRAFT_44733 [Aspergillus heterothallicus]
MLLASPVTPCNVGLLVFSPRLVPVCCSSVSFLHNTTFLWFSCLCRFFFRLGRSLLQFQHSIQSFLLCSALLLLGCAAIDSTIVSFASEIPRASPRCASVCGKRLEA